MIAIRKRLRMFGADERGATAIEYGLIAALIVIAMVGALEAMGGGINTRLWGKVGSAANTYMPSQ